MQDRSYMIAMAVVLAICCIGMYVAISGYLNANPPPVLSNSTAPPVQATLVVIVNAGTDTPVAPVAAITSPTAVTGAAPTSPVNALQTITAAGVTPLSPARTTPSPTSPPAKSSTVASLPPPPALPLPPVAPTSTSAPQGCTTPFCPKSGPPDATLGPGGIDCPRNYIFGRVVDLSGQGIPDRTIRFIGPSGEPGSIPTKGSPDPRGSYNLPTGQPGTTYTLWLVDGSGARVSPQVPITTQSYPGGGMCPNRLDFVQTR